MKLRCLRCGYRWPKRVKLPKMCPACKSRAWAKPKGEAK